MKNTLLIISIIFLSVSVCFAGVETVSIGNKLCLKCGRIVSAYQEFTYTTTPLYIPPNNKDTDGSIVDERRCQTQHTAEHHYTWYSSQGESTQISHSWTTSLKIAEELLGLEAGIEHTNGWSWACNTGTGESHTDDIEYTTPEGEYGYHELQWALSGNQYDGTEVEKHYCSDHTPGHLMSTHDHGAKTDKRKSRNPITSAGPWHNWAKDCDTERAGCGTDNMYCDGTSCTTVGCCHND